MRVARGLSTHMVWAVPGWRDGPDSRLWRPNEIVSLKTDTADPLDMIVAGVHDALSEEGARTEMETCGREAFDLEPLPDQHRRHAAGRGSNVGAGVNPRGSASR